MIDVQAIKDGDFVEFKSILGTDTEIGIYKSELVALPDYHEVWVNGSPAAARIVHEFKFVGHEPATNIGTYHRKGVLTHHIGRGRVT